MKHDLDNTYVMDAESATEMARLMIQDQHVTKTMGGLFSELPDLSQIHDILDIACGPGGWAMEVAYTYPEKYVVGVDISKQMIRYARALAESRALQNVTFQVMNVLRPLAFPEDSFDLVNARLLFGFMPPSAWPVLLQQCVRIVRPGGLIRLTEPERALSTSPAHMRWETLIATALRRAGQSLSVDDSYYGILPLLGTFLRNAGCTIIADKAHLTEYTVGQDIYESIYQNMKAALIEIQPFLLKMGLATQEELEQLYRQAMAEMLLPGFCAVYFSRTVCGQTLLTL